MTDMIYDALLAECVEQLNEVGLISMDLMFKVLDSGYDIESMEYAAQATPTT